MGKLNDELCRFVSRSEVFAELFNLGVYGGQNVVSKDNLSDVQRTYAESLPDRYGKKRKKIRQRDVVKALCRNGKFVRLAVENQAELNYCMPLRCLEYDVEDFARQLRRLKRHYKQEGGLRKTAEYLSGIRESDKLIPNITILLYHGAGKWDAANRLWDMIDVEALDEKLRKLHMDYSLHVVNLIELDESLLQTGLKELVKRKESCKNQGKGTFNMCVAFREMMQDSKEAGRKIGRAEGEKLGMRQGVKQGEEKLGTLICRMYREGRGEEVQRAAQSVRFRNQLYKEYGI